MPLKDQLESDLRDAMRARDQRRTSVIRLLRAAIANFEIGRTDRKNPQFGQPITEEDIVSAVRKELNQRREALEFARKANRPDLIEKEQSELEIVETYLPRQMGKDEIRAELAPLIADHGTEFKKVMPLAAQKLRGRADGRLVNEVVRELTGA
ncbi:MAG TPA: GatB/YqeY domain-containing protein [Chloroflexota bacterium]|nr:GatB/YqeY domain-containing protein [Chloroflexota bacterium]